jgi:hypothetical protein
MLKLASNPAAEIEWDKFNGTGQKHFPRDFKRFDFFVYKSVFDRANADRSVSIALAQMTKFRSLGGERLLRKDQIFADFAFESDKLEKLCKMIRLKIL